MRQFSGVLFILLGILLYGRIFMTDEVAQRRADEIANRHVLVPQPRGDEVTLPDHVLRPGEVEVAFLGGDGAAYKAHVEKQKASVFLKSTLAFIEEKRRDNRAATQRRIDAVFAKAFADKDAAVNDYADWFYGYFTSFELLRQGTFAMFGELLSLDGEKISAAPVKAVEEEMRKQYLDRVLKPHLRDPEIVKGIEEALAESHQEYLGALKQIDERVSAFIFENARYVAPVGAADRPQLKLDWDAESWRAPMERAGSGWSAGVAGLAITAGGALVGESILAGFSSLFATILAEAAVGTELVVGGAVAGSVEPVIGTAIGALAGLGVHGILNLFREKLERDVFVADVHKGLQVSITRWQELIEPKAGEVIDGWYRELQSLVATPNLSAKLES